MAPHHPYTRELIAASTLGVLLDCAPGHVTVEEIHQRVIELDWPTDNTAVRRALRAFTRVGFTHLGLSRAVGSRPGQPTT